MNMLQLPTTANFQVRDYYINKVCGLLNNGTTPADVMSSSRLRRHTIARHLVSWALYELEHLSLSTIARIMAIDHASIIYAVNKINGIKSFPAANPELCKITENLTM